MTTNLPAPSRLRMTAYAAAQLLLVVPTIVAFVLVVVGGATALVVVGLPILLVAVPACRWVADRHRAMAGRVLGTPFPPVYREPPAGGLGQRIVGWASDPMTWRDLAWLLVSATVGFALSLLVVLLFLLVVTWALWWFGVGPIMTARSALDRWLLAYGHTEVLERRVRTLTETRAESIDHSATELRRIERDLHDGAQARLVALGMSLGMAEEMWADDPDGAQQILREARATTGAALGDLRSVVRGIHPPRPGRPRAGRGGAGAGAGHGDSGDGRRRGSTDGRRLRSSRPSTSRSPSAWPTPASTPAPSAAGSRSRTTASPACFASSWATTAGVAPIPRPGTGMRGVMRRLSAFDGTMRVSSPPGGPTLVMLEIPCALSSPRTMPSSGTA